MISHDLPRRSLVPPHVDADPAPLAIRRRAWHPPPGHERRRRAFLEAGARHVNKARVVRVFELFARVSAGIGGGVRQTRLHLWQTPYTIFEYLSVIHYFTIIIIIIIFKMTAYAARTNNSALSISIDRLEL